MIITEVFYLRDVGFLFSRNTMHKNHTLYKKSFVATDGYYPPVCYLSYRNPPRIHFLDRKSYSNSYKITTVFFDR
jgi:hypothetical protein